VECSGGWVFAVVVDDVGIWALFLDVLLGYLFDGFVIEEYPSFLQFYVGGVVTRF